jgi:hypothetical protein
MLGSWCCRSSIRKIESTCSCLHAGREYFNAMQKSGLMNQNCQWTMLCVYFCTTASLSSFPLFPNKENLPQMQIYTSSLHSTAQPLNRLPTPYPPRTHTPESPDSTAPVPSSLVRRYRNANHGMDRTSLRSRQLRQWVRSLDVCRRL